MELLQELQKLNNDLLVSVKSLRKTGREKAAAEREYYVAKAQESLRLKESGQPVTMIQMIIKGEKNVAEKMFKFHVADVTHQANVEHVQATKLQMRLLEAQISREYGLAERMNS